MRRSPGRRRPARVVPPREWCGRCCVRGAARWPVHRPVDGHGGHDGVLAGEVAVEDRLAVFDTLGQAAGGRSSVRPPVRPIGPLPGRAYRCLSTMLSAADRFGDGDQTPVAGHHQHRGQTRPPTSRSRWQAPDGARSSRPASARVRAPPSCRHRRRTAARTGCFRHRACTAGVVPDVRDGAQSPARQAGPSGGLVLEDVPPKRLPGAAEHGPRHPPVSFYLLAGLADRYEALRAAAYRRVADLHDELDHEGQRCCPSFPRSRSGQAGSWRR